VCCCFGKAFGAGCRWHPALQQFGLCMRLSFRAGAWEDCVSTGFMINLTTFLPGSDASLTAVRAVSMQDVTPSTERTMLLLAMQLTTVHVLIITVSY
jgi:hypothetical protein